MEKIKNISFFILSILNKLKNKIMLILLRASKMKKKRETEREGGLIKRDLYFSFSFFCFLNLFLFLLVNKQKIPG